MIHFSNKQKFVLNWKVSISLPAYKNDNKSTCNDYRVCDSYKIRANKSVYDILFSRLIPCVEDIIGNSVCGVRRTKSTIDHISVIDQIYEKRGIKLVNTSVFEKYKGRLDWVGRGVLRNIIIEFDIHS